MTTAMPTPLPLDMPPGDAGALGELIREIAGAAVCLAAVDDRLLGAATVAPGWLGDDAAAAAAQVGAVSALVRAVSGAVLPAIGRLNTHAERVLETRRQVAALAAEQREQFAEAWGRWAQVESLQLQVMTGGPDARAIVEEVEAAEASRRRRHTALLEELEDDAAATARVLADSCAVVGGRGGPSDANRVVAYLAAELPGWGDQELARRGRALAKGLSRLLTSGEWIGNADAWNRPAAGAAPYARSTAFAQALLGTLGPDGVREMLAVLGRALLGPASDTARLLARALGAAQSSGSSSGRADAVLAAVYVDPDDAGVEPDRIALGMATVLSAGAGSRGGGLHRATVVEWGRQILLREQRMGRAIDRGRPMPVTALSVDPVPVVISALAQSGDPAAASRLLTGRAVWEVLLARSWDDGGSSLSQVVAAAGTDDGAAGEVAVRSGLAALGAGLSDGDPDDWTVDRETAAGISASMGQALSAHVSVVTEALQVGVDGRLTGGRDELLRGLGYLTLDRGAAAAVEQALGSWALVQPRDLEGTGPLAPLPSVAIPGAYLAVQEYGQRLAYALQEFEEQERAEDRQLGWDLTAGLATNLIRGPWGVPVGVLEGYLAIWLGFDGTWQTGTDRGLVLDRRAAVDAAVAQLPPDRVAAAEAVADQARAAFDRTGRALGLIRPPTSPEVDYTQPLVGGLQDLVEGRIDLDRGRVGGRLRLPR
jgi:hypothetical protein